MARIRTIKPEFWIDEKLAPLAPIHRLVFLGLISQADDDGRLVDNARLLNGLLFPETEDCCRDSLETLARLSRIVRYTSESGQKLIQIANWDKHQRVDKPSKHTLPPPSPEDIAVTEDTESSGESRDTLATPSRDALAPILDLGPRTMDRGPGSKPPREAVEVEEEPGDVDGSDGSDLPHAIHRMSAAELIHAWGGSLPERPTEAERRKQKPVARRLTREHTRDELVQAMVGMTALFPHSPPPNGKSEPWDLGDLERKFSKAKAKALDHPDLKARRAEAAFMGGAA